MQRNRRNFIAILLLACMLLTGCSGVRRAGRGAEEGQSAAENDLLRLAEFEPDTLDPQCAVDNYTVAVNVFDRLVEVGTDEAGNNTLAPSLAESWTVSQDGLVYAFRLREGVAFSNGEPLTASDVRFTLTRLLTNPRSRHPEIAARILGAGEVLAGRATELSGIHVIDDLNLTVTLISPDAAFLASLTSPAASILSELATTRGGLLFGRSPEYTVGTGPFLLEEWDSGAKITLRANADCWSGAPLCGGISIRLVTDAEAQRRLFESGELDVLDLEGVGYGAEYYIRGDVYQDQLHKGVHVGMAFLALNEAIAPLDDVRVRRAMQLALDRETLLAAIAGGRGVVETGLFPCGMTGYDQTGSALTCDLEQARRLMNEAGYADGFNLKISVPASGARANRELLALVAAMWAGIGVRANVVEIDAGVFAERRSSGTLACYCENWSAPYDDPAELFDTFFGSAESSRANSLCYSDEATMRRVREARGILNAARRMEEYRALEKKLVQEDAAWVPLFSPDHYYLTSERVRGFELPWNGGSDVCYRGVALSD